MGTRNVRDACVGPLLCPPSPLAAGAGGFLRRPGQEAAMTSPPTTSSPGEQLPWPVGHRGRTVDEADPHQQAPVSSALVLTDVFGAPPDQALADPGPRRPARSTGLSRELRCGYELIVGQAAQHVRVQQAVGQPARDTQGGADLVRVSGRSGLVGQRSVGTVVDRGAWLLRPAGCSTRSPSRSQTRRSAPRTQENSLLTDSDSIESRRPAAARARIVCRDGSRTRASTRPAAKITAPAVKPTA
jgi:hypothetical protein